MPGTQHPPPAPPVARIAFDPRLESQPDFEHTRWAQAISSHNGTRDEAVQHFLKNWQDDRDERTALWLAQELADDAAAKALEESRLQHEADAKAQQEAAEEAERLAADKKKPKAPDMDDDLLAPEYSEVSPSSYVRKKLRDYEFCELHYFHPDKCRESLSAARDSDKTFNFIDSGEGKFSLEASAAKRAGKIAVKEDKQLTWAEVSLLKPIYLRTLTEVGWPDKLVKTYYDLFFALDIHPIRAQPHGDEVVIRYLAETRPEWHKLHTDGKKVFNIGEISESRLRNIDQAVLREHQVRQTFPTSTSSRPRSPPPDRRRYRSRSRSRSPGHRRQSSSRHSDRDSRGTRSESRDDRRGRQPFRDDTRAPATRGACVVCLGRHAHDVRRCTSATFHNSTQPTLCLRGGEHFDDLLTRITKELVCLHFNLDRGCHNEHGDKRSSRVHGVHKCSGCGQGDHGAQKCPIASRA